MRIGIDIGSTTLKCAVLGEKGEILFQSYERHFSNISGKTSELLAKIRKECGAAEAELSISGSAGMGIAEQLGIPFVQEVYATRCSVKRLIPDADVIIELGGEDAKIIYLTQGTGGPEMRMNGSCAGGTGAFIDQMATLLNVTPDQMNGLASEKEKIYSIASRCGVFAKSDIQPLLNQGAKLTDLAASIFHAVVGQTVAGLAQGRPIEGKVVYLGGPLTYFPELRKSFDETLRLEGVCPENSLYFVALGAIFTGTGKKFNLAEAEKMISGFRAAEGYKSCPRLFSNEKEYAEFTARHAKANVPVSGIYDPDKTYYLGIDAGSTTVKAALVGEDGGILYSDYVPNSGNPVPIVKKFLENVYGNCPDLKLGGTAVTGYGEELVKNAFSADYGIVETMAHFLAAKHFSPKLDFILDIGGQDIKCFKIKNNNIDNIFLNEACSSGCGSFLQTFAGALGMKIADFAKLGLFADRPVDLGSRCTVFMNSSVKQAQKDGASIENISAGLSVSVVKNALYKVIRAVSADALGEHIVVQGGTFLNDAVLRAFETEIGRQVVRPNIAGLMGAYGAALYAKTRSASDKLERSSLLSADKLAEFSHSVRATVCAGCTNRCKLTVNTFDGGRKFIGGNRCDTPGSKKTEDDTFNLYARQRRLLSALGNLPAKPSMPTVGLPLGLNFYELLPFWHAFFSELGFGIRVTEFATRDVYLAGQHTIPSDTVCFPAKLMHGQIDALVRGDSDAIFYPCMSYHIDEGLGDNHYNCPVVAYYPEVLSANVPELKAKRFIYDYIGIHRRKDFTKKIAVILSREFPGKVTAAGVGRASDAAYAAYAGYLAEIRRQGREVMEKAEAAGRKIVVLSGRPYHLDPEVNHGIDALITNLGAAVVTEESLSDRSEKFRTHVLNQWTFHARLYAAAKFVADSGRKDLNLVQLVSFGCGLDAITTDETRRILENAGRIYTQIKIDEITNLGAVKIRLRSLFETLGTEE